MATPTDAHSTLDLPKAMIDTITPAADWVIVLPVVLALIGAALLLVLRNARTAHAPFSVMIVMAIIVCDIALLMRVLDTGPMTMTMGQWLPPFGISFTADVMGALFALASATVTLIVIIYASTDVNAREERYGFYAMVLLLLAGVSGSFLTGDFFNLYVWFEVMLIASFGLMIIGGRKLQLDGAVKYGFLNFLATTFFLIGLGYLYGLIGTLNMADIIRVAPEAPKGAMAAVAALFLLAFGMKAAAFPVNTWLPAAYHTPDPAVSALFAGLLTKVGVYALLRTMLALLPASRDWLDPVIGLAAVLTLVIAPLGAMAETNLRRAIGFFVIGGIGAVLAGLALPSLQGVAGATLYAFHSILTMTALYLTAGLVERMTGATDTRHMGGVYGASSPLSILFIILVFAAAGLPPFLGFWPKLLLVEAGVGEMDWVLVAAILLNSLLTSIAGTRIWAHVFWRAGRDGEHAEQPNDHLVPLDHAHRWRGLAPTAVLVGGIVLLGLWPNGLFEAGRIAADDILTGSRYIQSVGLAEDAQ